MDWPKIKTILIIAFLVTNTILGYNLYVNEFKENRDIFLKEEYMQNLNTLLESKNIKLNTKIPKDSPKLSFLSVQYEERKFKDLFPNSNQLKVIENKKIEFKGKVNLKKFNKKEVKEQAEKFLNNHDFNKEYYLKYEIEKDGYIEVVYCGKYKKYFLEESYMQFTFYPSGAFDFERLWLTPIEEKRQKKRVITSAEAIINAFDEFEKNVNIEEIKLGYYFKLEEDMNLKKMKTATAEPMWRIKTSNNKYYYVKAFDF